MAVQRPFASRRVCSPPSALECVCVCVCVCVCERERERERKREREREREKEREREVSGIYIQRAKTLRSADLGCSLWVIL